MNIKTKKNQLTNVYKDKIMKKYIEEDEGYDTNPNYKFHGIETRAHMCVVGPTKSGKTNFLYRMMQSMTDTFKEIYIFTPTVKQKVYVMLEKEFKVNIMTLDKAIPHTQLEQKCNKLVIFDDFIDCAKDKRLQGIIMQYAISGRHSGISTIFLIQDYCSLAPRIRNQCQYIVMLKTNNTENLKTILRKSAIPLKHLNVLTDIITACTEEKFQVFFIDNTPNIPPKYKLRQNFNNIINIDETMKSNEVVFYDNSIDKKTNKEIIKIT